MPAAGRGALQMQQIPWRGETRRQHSPAKIGTNATYRRVCPQEPTMVSPIPAPEFERSIATRVAKVWS